MGKTRRGWWALGLMGALAAMTITAHAVEEAPTGAATPGGEHVADENAGLKAIVQAMQVADAPALLKLYQESADPIVHVWSAMALERVHFNLDGASAAAQACEQALLDTHPGLALSCGQFRIGNLQLAGRPAEARQAEQALIEHYRGHRVDRRLDAMQAYLDNRAAQPPLSYEVPAGDVSLPTKQDAAIPTVKAKANGHEFELMLDTGASDMILGEDAARRYGVKPLDRNGKVSGWLSKGVPTQAGVLDTLELGGIILHNVPVTVVPKPIALIGSNLVAPLGTLRISSQSVLVYGRDSTVPACDTPMLAGSGLWDDQLRLFPRLLVNDQPQSVMLDSGAYRYLIGTRTALDEVTALHRRKTTMRDVGGTHAFANAESAKVNLTIAGQPFDILFEVYTDATNIKYPITLGAGALRDMDFLLDFRHQRQCFLLHPNLR